MSVIISGTTGIDAGSLPVANTGKISAGAGLPAILNTAGVDRVIVDTTGNVGIGITSSEKLHLYNGSATTTVMKAQNSISSAQYGLDNAGFAYAWSSDAPRMIFGTNKSDGVIQIQAGGGTKGWIDSNGLFTINSPTGGIGYGGGAGGTVTQLTSKSTAVTLNKPSGQITMNNAALAAGASVYFTVQNSLVAGSDNINAIGFYAIVNPANYKIEPCAIYTGNFQIRVTNITGGALAEALIIEYTVIKGAVA